MLDDRRSNLWAAGLPSQVKMVTTFLSDKLRISRAVPELDGVQIKDLLFVSAREPAGL